MNWNLVLQRLDATLSTPLPDVDGAVHIAEEAPDLEALLEEAAENEGDRSALYDDGWYLLSDKWSFKEVLSFEYLSSPAGGTLAWWLLEVEDGRRYAVYQMDDRGAVVFARLDGDPEALFGPVLEQFLATNGESVGVEESITMLPDLIHNRKPELLPEASVRAGALAFMGFAEKHYGGWDYLSKEHPDPQTREEKEAAFAAYWTRSYTEAENPYQR